MSSISDYRDEIERIDQKLIALFEKRMTVSGKVAAWKKTRDLPVKDEKREAELYRKWKNMLHNPEFEPYLHTIFSSLMGVSCAYQQTLLKEDVKKVAVYMGVPGSNGEAAALSQFSMDQIVGVDSFEGVIEAVHSGAVEFGFLPIENSTTGSVTDVYDLLVTSNVSIVGETYVNVCHALLGVKGAKIEDVCEVYSHAQGFSQCKEFLSLHPEWLKIPYYNTAIAARLVGEAGDKRKAAIASPRAAEIYNLDVLNPCVNTGKQNQTRFVMIASHPQAEEEANKVSIAFVLPHVSGSLSRALEIFQKAGVNLLKIESRPIVDQMGEYRFFVDFEGNLRDDKTNRALSELMKLSRDLKIFGNYLKAE